MVDAPQISELFESHFEWLAVRENGRTHVLRRDEINIEQFGNGALIGFVADEGFIRRRVKNIEPEDSGFSLQLTDRLMRREESVHFSPRESAAELSANIEIARLRRANEMADALSKLFPDTVPGRVSLSGGNGRLANILFRSKGRTAAAIQADVTSSLTHEALLAAAIKWLDVLQARKKDPVATVHIASSKRRSSDLRRLHALLKKGIRSRIELVELEEQGGEFAARFLRPLTTAELWRAKPQKLMLPDHIEPSEKAELMVAFAPDKIDIVHSRKGETVRFRGLPFARVRRVMGRERAWFGAGISRRPLNERSNGDLHDLVDELMLFRDAQSPSKRHDVYRLASEAWLESILRRNIKALDSNLILSPLYSQFKTAAEKIDLLALRKDGRLVIIELKTTPDREAVFQAADYWRKIELQRRRGELAKARLFGDLDIADSPTLVYVAAPALSFHRDFEYFAKMLSEDIELWRWELHENWREKIKVLARINYAGRA